MIAHFTNLKAHEFVHTFRDLHLYNNHLDQAREQLKREPYPLPKMEINPEVKSIYEFTSKDFKLLDYEAHPHIKAPIAV